MAFQNVGTFNGGVHATRGGGGAPMNGIALNDAAIASGMAFLVSELEKRDPMIRNPLTSFTYARDVVIRTGGGWVDAVSAMAVSYGITGGGENSGLTAGGANATPIVQASMDKGIYRAHAFAAALRIKFIDMQKSNFIGRSLDQILTDGVRMAYDKYMDKNTYLGFADFGTTGLINNDDVVETTVADGADGTSEWSTKTPDEILKDINDALTAVWAAAEYDPSAVPNHIILPYEQLTYIQSQKVSDLAGKSILTYIMENNIANLNGQSLFIGGTAFCKGAGTGDADRMVVYVNHDRYLAMDELVPLSRVMSTPNAAESSYDTSFMANVSELQLMYPQTVGYFDGI